MVVLLAGAVASLQALVEYGYQAWSEKNNPGWRAFGPFLNPNLLAATAILLAPVAFAWMLSAVIFASPNCAESAIAKQLACAAAIVLSGSFNAYVEVAELPALWSSAYGRVLALKVVLVLGALALGAMNRYRLLPALSESAERVIAERPPDRAPARLLMSRYVAGEVILVVVVFGCTALLGQLPPPRRGDAFHDASHTHVE